MATIHFRPNKGIPISDKTKEQIIYVRFRLGSKVDFNASLGVKVLISDWDTSKQRIKNRSIITNRFENNQLLDSIENYLKAFDNQNRIKGYTPNYQEVKEHYNQFFTSKEQSEQTLFTFIDEFIERSRTQPNTITKKLVSSGTIQSYIVTKNLLKRFNDEVYKIDFESITLSWYYDFLEFCNKQNLSINYFGKNIKTLKTFMTNAVELGLTNNEQFKSRKFIVLKEETDSVYLTTNELEKLWELDLSINKTMQTARDLFLIGAYTGLRVSDYNSLSERNIKTELGVRMLKVKTEKTGRIVAIPLHPIIEQILIRYEGTPPPKMSDQKLNDLIKVIAENAGLDSVEYITQTKGGKEITVKKYKFELVVTHTARRSFCTNAYLAGMSSLDIMSISGHKTESSFMKYIKVTPEQVAIKMSEHVFFKGSNHLKVV
jgi:site-specific recombinase XerD